MRVMIITQKNREEFKEIGFDDVTKRVAQNLYHGNSLEAARAWLKENDPAWMSARAARAAGTKAIIALVLSGRESEARDHAPGDPRRRRAGALLHRAAERTEVLRCQVSFRRSAEEAHPPRWPDLGRGPRRSGRGPA